MFNNRKAQQGLNLYRWFKPRCAFDFAYNQLWRQ